VCVCVQRKGQTHTECVSEKPASLKCTLPLNMVHKSTMRTAAPVGTQTADSPGAEAGHKPLR